MSYLAASLVTALLLARTAAAVGQSATPELARIGHILVIVLENRSFDHLYGTLPGVEGIDQASASQRIQVDAEGRPYPRLPPVLDTRSKPAVADPRFPVDLPNGPFLLDGYAKPDERTGDLTHRFYQNQAQIAGGRMNGFVANSNAGGLTMGYYDSRTLPLADYARRYTVADHFFQAAFGGSFINHQWLICACTPTFADAPAAIRAVVGADGRLERDGAVSPDAYVVNTLQPSQRPHSASAGHGEPPLPPLTAPTIGDRLSAKGIDWAWYAGGWRAAEAGSPPADFQFHHQPFVYYAAYAEGSEARRQHLRDGDELAAAIDQGRLPPVAFYKPVGALNEHAGYADVLSGERHLDELLKRIERSPIWKDSVVIVTYDEYGGFWDHVAPPKLDRFGPGPRIPALIVSPFSGGGRVDSTVYDHTSILRLIEDRFGLEPLTERDAKAHSLAKALRFGPAKTSRKH